VRSDGRKKGKRRRWVVDVDLYGGVGQCFGRYWGAKLKGWHPGWWKRPTTVYREKIGDVRVRGGGKKDADERVGV
jgi:hypothetical protein